MKYKSLLATTLVVLSLLALHAPTDASNPKIIGQWVDNAGKSWQQDITIVQKGQRFFRISKFQDGSSNQAELVEVKAEGVQGRVFVDTDSSFGEFCIIDANGNLDLYDEEGFIREAKKAR